jgi:hypothetical protein
MSGICTKAAIVRYPGRARLAPMSQTLKYICTVTLVGVLCAGMSLFGGPLIWVVPAAPAPVVNKRFPSTHPACFYLMGRSRTVKVPTADDWRSMEYWKKKCQGLTIVWPDGSMHVEEF